MSDFEGVKRNAAQTFSNVVRNSGSLEKLDPQQMLLVMASLLEPLREGQPLDTTPLADYLKNEKQLTPTEIEELLVFFQSRQDKLGFQVILPVSMQNVGDARRQKIIEKFNKAPKQATYSGSSKEPPPGQPAGRQETMFDKRKPVDAATSQRKRFAAAAAFILVGGAFGAYQLRSLPDPPTEVTLTDTSGALECVRLKVVKTSAFCTIDKKKVMKLPQAERDKRKQATIANLRKQKINVDRLVMIDSDGGRTFR